MSEDLNTKTSTQLTKDAKAIIQLAFQDLGGLPRLVEWANTPGNIGAFYTQIWAKIIPKDVKAEVTGKDGGDIKMQLATSLNIKGLSDEELALFEKIVSDKKNTSD